MGLEVLGLAAAVTTSAASTVFDYNRAAWQIDLQHRQQARGQKQALVISQVGILREDVRDTIQPAMQKQGNQILAITLILGVVAALLVSPGVAGSWYLKSLYNLCVASTMFYLVLALACSLAANYLTSVCQRELLTKMVRLPLTGMLEEMRVGGAMESVASFEDQGFATVFRVPGLSRLRQQVGAFTDLDSDSDSDSISMGDHMGESWMAGYKRHFAKRRRNWEFLSTCASISAFLGMGNLLSAWGYLASSEVLFSEGSEIPSSWTGVIFCTTLHVMMAVGFNSSFSSSGWYLTAWLEALAIVTAQSANFLCVILGTDSQPNTFWLASIFLCHAFICLMVIYRMSLLTNGSIEEGEEEHAESVDVVEASLLKTNQMSGEGGHQVRKRRPLISTGSRRVLRGCMLGNWIVAVLWVLSLGLSVSGVGNGELESFNSRLAVRRLETVATTPEFSEVLTARRLSDFEVPLLRLGVTSAEQLKWIGEPDLAGLGMGVSQRRELLELSPGGPRSASPAVR